MGPFRMTTSKSGISYSAGLKGASVTRRANGRVQTTFSVPGTGLRHTTTSGRGRRGARPAARPATATARAVRLSGQGSSAAPKCRRHGRCPSRSRATWPSSPSTKAASTSNATRAAKLNGNHSSDIAWTDITAADFRAPNLIRNGHVHFATPGNPR
jgi:hypothetical protein